MTEAVQEPPPMTEAVQEPPPVENNKTTAPQASEKETQVKVIESVKCVLESTNSPEADVLEALQKLQALGSLPTGVLRETMVGKSVNTLAKSGKSDGIRRLARQLVESWRTEVQSKKRKSSANLDDQAQKMQRSISVGSNLSDSQPGTLERSDSTFSNSGSMGENDEKKQLRRQKVMEKILDALGKKEQIEAKDGDDKEEEQMKDFDKLAREIEAALWAKFEKDDKGYINQSRSLLYNLKDSKNASFRFKIAMGFWKPSDVPELSAEQMASDEKNAERRKMREDAMAEIDTGWALKHGAARISGMFTCGKCKGTKTTYFQMQTRSSDEPMTTFVTCITCNNRWKFC